MYVPDNYSNYHYVVEYHDNYIILSNSRNVTGDYMNPDTINVIYQYFEPSTLTIPTTYTTTQTRSFSSVDIDSSFWERADSPKLFACSFLILLMIMFIINGLTRLIRPRGILL